MYKLALLVLACGIISVARSSVIEIPDEDLREKRTIDGTNPGPQALVNMNGQYNYQAGQQVFFINDWRRRRGPKNCVNFIERDDYEITVGIGAHKLHRRNVTWNQARKSCKAEGGQLAVINSESEERLFLNWMQKENSGRVWLGIHDQFEEGDWITLNEEPLSATGFEKWTTLWPNEPDNIGGNQNCGILETLGGMDDIACDSHFSYICEINLC
ncbi:hemolymph lipopolysaccharide-binding protein-like isoform X1 [Colletes gigas]|uniref:hemolymph lipopolysaccharide-binding protein-like isoform X1 n=1 Tax=Colletes gigas TaxID=935657 RepID=UPI001C9AF8EF|nr:hemolymph lipopolysaccharide-binding protein-like isoform X1 [Colletes gigas]